ncbi:hypothetical protein E2C01_013641 [Portunus trituberculatus]|uniref:Uncharacterized protein n=1 Tax=Portunus trituberculatus TaxID=210409 RepID=A0A5B7DHU0_PORTR|nr:hypothetical protein [Portunus trituberculatus]
MKPHSTYHCHPCICLIQHKINEHDNNSSILRAFSLHKSFKYEQSTL